jgi:hypothetical protein
MLTQSRMSKTTPENISDKISEKRLAANRANADRSTGPRTPEGKSRSAQNARQHGFTAAKFAVVRLDELDALANLRADAIATYQPVNSQELYAVERLALAQQALLRCSELEAGLHTAALNETITNGAFPTNLLSPDLTIGVPVAAAQNRALCLAVGFQRLNTKSDSWKLFLRYQAQTERNYRRAVEELERLRALRSELPNEPIADPEPQPIELLTPNAPDPDRPYEAFPDDPTMARTSPLPPSFPMNHKNRRNPPPDR